MGRARPRRFEKVEILAKSQNSDKKTDKGDKNVETPENVEDAVFEEILEDNQNRTEFPEDPDAPLSRESDSAKDDAETVLASDDPERNIEDSSPEISDETAPERLKTKESVPEDPAETPLSDHD